ncbi:MAG: aminotransferase class I/II-fold pyridoxal phosphate-dependent enzyme [Patescibacteria group bacterium]
MKKSRQKPEIRVSYAQAVYGKEEIDAVVKVLGNPSKISPGAAVTEFENKIAKLFGKKYGIMVNSGSSANLIAFAALDLPPGSEVITPVLTFSTTVAPLVQRGLVPVFVDVVEGAHIIDIDKVEAAITKKTRALMIPSLFGNIPDFPRLKKIARKHKLVLIEDSCDTLGAQWNGKSTGIHTDISTTSFYATHAITAAGAGGMVCFNDPKLARRARVMASWGRQSTLFGAFEKSEDIKRRFAGRIDGEVYDAKFLFTEVGYNMQSTELNGAFGLVQLTRLSGFTKLRQHRFKQIYDFVKKYGHLFILPVQDRRAHTSWMSFPLIIRSGAPFTRAEITKYLEERNIQTRPLFTGNITRQPAYKKIRYRAGAESFPVADHVMRNGFVFGCHHGMSDGQVKYLLSIIEEFITAHA